MSYKTIHDPIHGIIKIPDKLMPFIDNPIYQRLRNIKQLATVSYVFPSAQHTRFEHSVGVCHIAEKLLRNLQIYQPELQITENDIEMVQLGALMHDLGHGPYSHVFDNEIIPNIDANPVYNEHECRSAVLFGMICNKYIDNSLLTTNPHLANIYELINPAIPQNSREFIKNNEDSKFYLKMIVSNPLYPIDVDKLDYLSRDSYYLGIEHRFSCDRFINEIRVINGILCYPIKMITPIYEIFELRFKFHKKVYNHPVVKAIEYMIRDIILEEKDQLNLVHRLCLMEKFIGLDDSILNIIRFTTKNQKVIDLIDRIANRDLYKLIKTININKDSNENKNLLLSILESDNRIKYGNNLIIQEHIVHLGNKHLDPFANIPFFNKNDSKTIIYKCFNDSNLLEPKEFIDKKLRIFSKSPAITHLDNLDILE